MARRLGTAYVGIEADASLFRATAMAGMKKALAGLEGKIPVDADLKKARRDIAGFLAELQLLHPEINMGLDTNQAKRVIEDFRSRVAVLASELDDMRANPDLTHGALGSVTRLQIAVRNAAEDLKAMKPDSRGLQDFEHRIIGLENAWDRVTDSVKKVARAEEDAGARLRFFQALSPEISNLAGRIRVLGDSMDENVVAGARRAQAALAALGSRKFEISPAGFTRVRSDLAAIVASVGTMETRLREAGDAEAALTAKTAESARMMDILLPRVNELTRRLGSMRMRFDDKDVQVAIDGILARLIRIRNTDVTPENFLQMIADIGKAELAADGLVSKMEKVAEAEREATAQAEFFAKKIAPGLDEISARLAGMKAGLDDKVFQARLADMEAAVARFRAKKIGFDDASMKAAEAELATLFARTETLGIGVGNLNDRLTRGRVAWFGWIGGLLSAKVALFAGAREIAGWHIALDAVVETLAILTPALAVAALGLGAFGLEAFLAQDTLTRIAQHMQYVNTVSEATGKAIPPLTDHFDQMAKVIRPQVFQLLGAAIGGTGGAMKILDKAAVSTGDLLDKWAARIVVAMNSGGSGIQHFLAIGQEDLKQLGVLFTNLGHIIVKVGQVATQTHIAEDLLKGLSALSGVFRLVSDLPGPLLVGLALLHGWYVWAGLATTALVKMALAPARGLLNLIAGAKNAGTEVKNLDKEAGSVQRLKAYFSDIGTAAQAIPGRLKEIGKVIVTLAKSPWTWVGLAAAALIGLGIAAITAKTSTERFIDSLNQMTQQATVFNLVNTLGAELILTNQHLAAATGQLNDEFKKNVDSGSAITGRYASLGKAYSNTAVNVRQLTAEQKNAYGDLLLTSTRVGELSAKFGTKGLAGTMALAALAGVKVSDFLSRDPATWSVAVQRIQDLISGFQAMGQGVGQVAADLNALTIAGSDVAKQLGEVNKAFDSFTQTVSAPVSTFLSFTQTIQRFGQDAQVAGARMTGLGGGLEAASKKVRSSSVQLQQDFQDTFNAAEQLFDAMRASGAPADVQVAAIKHAVAAMIPMAGTSKVAAAEISALAQEAGMPATTSLQALSKWAGKTHDPLDKLQQDSNKAAIGFYNMSLDAQKLGTALSQDLTQDMAKSVEAAVGLQAAMDKYNKDVQAGTETTKQGLADRQALSNILVGITGSQKSANAVIAAGTDKIHAIAEASHNAGPVTKAAFDKMTASMHLSAEQSLNLWLEMKNNLSPILQELAQGKVPAAKKAFEEFAGKSVGEGGLGLSIKQADTLWNTLKNNNLDGTGKKADTARGKFENLARQMGLNVTQADNLYTALHNLPANTNLKVTMDGTGNFDITEGGKHYSISPGGMLSPHAAGGFISGGVPGQDSVPGLLMPGEVVVPTAMVNAGAVDHLRGMLPGFAAGGVVGVRNNSNIVDPGPGATANWRLTPSFVGGMYTAFVGQMAREFAVGLKAAVKTAGANSGQAVLAYAETFKGRAPYVWGGSTPSGWDCSGFVSYVYDHFNLFHGRTTAAGLQQWAKPSVPTPGGMAFYGTPAHHVGFVVDGHTLLSALGRKWGTIESNINMGDNSGYGVPPGGFGKSAQAPLGAGGSLPKGKIQELAFSLLTQYGWGNQWASFNNLEMHEAGYDMFATNQSTKAYGLGQFYDPPGADLARNKAKYFAYGGNPNTALGQLTGMFNYIANVYGSPNAAWAQYFNHPGGVGSYAAGGLVPGYAAGGTVSATKWVPQLSKSQTGEARDYAGLVAAYKHDLAHAVKGSWTAAHKAGITSELKTLAARQATEAAAYKTILSTGTAKGNVTHMGTAAKGVNTVSKDVDLSHSHKGWTHGLQGWLASIIKLATQNVTSAPGTQNRQLQWPVWLKTIKDLEGKEGYYYAGLQAAFKYGLAHAPHSSWLFKNRKAIGERLYAVAVKHNAERKAYTTMLSHSNGQLPGLDKLPDDMGAMKNAARAEYNAMQPSLLSHVPGGHPGWVKPLMAALKAIYSIHGTPGPAWAPAPLGPSHTATKGVLQFEKGGKVFDTGGWLDTGPNLVWNKTGAPEHLTPDHGGGGIHIHLTNQGVIGSQQQLDAWLTTSVNRLARTGYIARAAVRT